jgi:large subunit ribosomal protein L35
MAKFKVKTRKAAAKRYTVKSSGKVKRAKAGKAHLNSGKSRKRKNKLKKAAYVHPSNLSRVLPCLPNG